MRSNVDFLAKIGKLDARNNAGTWMLVSPNFRMDALLKKMKFAADGTKAVVGFPTDHLLHACLQSAGASYAEDFNGKFQWIAVAVMNAAEVGSVVPKALASLAQEGLLWIVYPKKSGKIKTDLSRDHGWDAVMNIGLRHLNLISIDENWSAWAVEHGQAAVSEKTRQKSESRNALLAQYMDHSTREMRYPPEMEATLCAHPAEWAFFQQLSFTNRKEYVEWIVTAKRAETKQQRLEKIVGYLREGRKNPAGR